MKLKKSQLKKLIGMVIEEGLFNRSAQPVQKTGYPQFDAIIDNFAKGYRYLTIVIQGNQFRFLAHKDPREILKTVGMQPHITIEMKNIVGNVSK